MTDEPFDPDDVVDPPGQAEGEASGAARPPKRRKESVGQTIGGVLFGFEQQVLRTMPPPQELVHHARPDAPVAAGDGSLIHISMPGVELPEEPGADDGARDRDERRSGG
jgi:hypothetical protein